MAGQVECRRLVKEYVDYLARGFVLNDYGESGCQVITPYWRHDGDHIEFFAVPADGGQIVLTDEGQTFDWLFSVGVDVESGEARQELTERLAARYGATLEDGVISTQLAPTDIGAAIHRFLTALRAISQLILLQQPRGKPTFREEVELYLIENDQEYTPNFRIKGKTVEHQVDFYVNSRRNMLVEALTASSLNGARNAIPRIVFKWIDIREAGWGYEKVVVVDDDRDKWEQIWNRSRIRLPLENYSDRVIRWSNAVALLGPLTR